MTMLHVSSDDLETYVANELEGEALANVEEHLAGCDECGRKLADVAREELAFHALWRQGAFCAGCGRAVDSHTCGFCGALAVLDGYDVEKILKESGRGRTYLARSESGEQVVVKELVFSTAPSADEVKAFEREAQILKTLNHPGIPKFRASMHTGDGVHKRLYLVQDYVDGVSLGTKLEHHRFDEAEVLELVEQVLEILVYLQSHNPMVFHRDIKPDNLVLDARGKVWLVDFGAARDRGPTAGATLVGTFGYMPVEQLGGIVDATTDVYALGATATHLLSRREPWELLQDDHALAPLSLSPSAGVWLKRAVARKAEDRWPSAEAALQALRRERRAIVAGGLAAQSKRGPVGRFVHHYGASLAAAASFLLSLAMVSQPAALSIGDSREPLAGLLLFAAVAFYLSRPRDEDAEDVENAAKRRRRRRRWQHFGVVAACAALFGVAAGHNSPSERLSQAAFAAYRDGEFARCGELFEDAAKRSPGHEVKTLLYNAASCYARAEEPSSAFAALERAVHHGYSDVDHLRADYDLGNLRADPRWSEILALAARPGPMTDSADRLRQRAVRSYAAHDFERCEQLYEAAATRDTGNAPTDYYNGACCAALAGNLDHAFELLDRASRSGWGDVGHAAADDDLLPLRQDPRWPRLMERMVARRNGLPLPPEPLPPVPPHGESGADSAVAEAGTDLEVDVDLGLDGVELESSKRERIEVARRKLHQAARELRQVLRSELGAQREDGSRGADDSSSRPSR